MLEPDGGPSAVVDLGTQYLIELRGCARARLASVAGVEADLRAAAARIGATVLSAHFHQFDPEGVSGVLVISESHLAVHTWPEHGYAAVDLFTCGPRRLDPTAGVAALVASWGARDHEVRAVARGRLT